MLGARCMVVVDGNNRSGSVVQSDHVVIIAGDLKIMTPERRVNYIWSNLKVLFLPNKYDNSGIDMD